MPETTIYNMDVMEGLHRMKESNIEVDTIVTSPPYWGLRDYGVEGQLGLEEHPQQYVQKMVDVFRACKPILKKTGSLFLNLGDTYYSKSGSNFHSSESMKHLEDHNEEKGMERVNNLRGLYNDGKWLQPKQKLLIPHRVAIAMQDDGWILRNDVVWHKPNHLPSSVRDRLTTSFEYLFHFVRQKKYYYDLDAIREPYAIESVERLKRGIAEGHKYADSPSMGGGGGINKPRMNMKKIVESWEGNSLGQYFGESKKDYANAKAQNASDVKRRILNGIVKSNQGYTGKFLDNPDSYNSPRARKANRPTNDYSEKGKNPGDVWTISPQPYADAHFATFPRALIHRPILATCPKDGIVLDPFVGSGTTLLEAREQGKNGIGIELNPKYVDLIIKRLRGDVKQTALVENIKVISK